ncbi:hypothetical protein JQN58_05490 [Aneurinibacillus sp. BA2021]|nr:hypothetical protein [Aneurinibacillus sp. BA2021]
MDFDFQGRLEWKYRENADLIDSLVTSTLKKNGLESHSDMVYNLLISFMGIYTNEMLVPVLKEFQKEIDDHIETECERRLQIK